MESKQFRPNIKSPSALLNVPLTKTNLNATNHAIKPTASVFFLEAAEGNLKPKTKREFQKSDAKHSALKQ